MQRLAFSRWASPCLGVLLLTAAANAGPIIDGVLSPTDNYANHSSLSYALQTSPGTTINGGDLYWTQDPTTKDLSILFIQPTSVVDNTYGTNAIGWSHHNFSDLVSSDKAEFKITDNTGKTVFDGFQDYTSQSGSTYKTLGFTGGDGSIVTGSASYVKAVGTSIDYNFNTLGDKLTTNSPATDSNYTPNPSYPGWEFKDAYEVQFAGSMFGGNTLGDILIPLVHDSPSKLGSNKIIYCPQPSSAPPPVPEPSSALLLGLAGLGALLRRRKAS